MAPKGSLNVMPTRLHRLPKALLQFDACTTGAAAVACQTCCPEPSRTIFCLCPYTVALVSGTRDSLMVIDAASSVLSIGPVAPAPASQPSLEKKETDTLTMPPAGNPWKV